MEIGFQTLSREGLKAVSRPQHLQMRNDLEKYSSSSVRPYELLSSHTFTIDDILFCERFTNTYYALNDRLGAQRVRLFAKMAGSLSALVQFVMARADAAQADTSVVNAVLAELLQAGGAGRAENFPENGASPSALAAKSLY